MSSIYRKGRDGYFYYQTYVYDHNSGKKSKKIFHSLGTKDENVAIQKKRELDIKYEKSDKSIKNHFKNIRSKILLLILLITLLSFYMISQSKSQVASQEIEIVPQIDSALSITSGSVDEPLNNLAKDKISTIEKDIRLEIKLPNFTITRIDSLFGGFNQIKIFINTDSNAEKEILHGICKAVYGQYTNFSNIIICIYDNSDTGLSLASGRENNFVNEDQKTVWLAMFTYNAIEGEYFDNNPSRYLGIN